MIRPFVLHGGAQCGSQFGTAALLVVQILGWDGTVENNVGVGFSGYGAQVVDVRFGVKALDFFF